MPLGALVPRLNTRGWLISRAQLGCCSSRPLPGCLWPETRASVCLVFCRSPDHLQFTPLLHIAVTLPERMRRWQHFWGAEWLEVALCVGGKGRKGRVVAATGVTGVTSALMCVECRVWLVLCCVSAVRCGVL